MISLFNSYGVTIVAKDFPSTRHLPKIATEASGALWVPPAMMVKRAKKTLLDEDQAEHTAMDKMLKVLCYSVFNKASRTYDAFINMFSNNHLSKCISIALVRSFKIFDVASLKEQIFLKLFNLLLAQRTPSCLFRHALKDFFLVHQLRPHTLAGLRVDLG